VKDRRLGGFGRATAFSFYATKNLTTAEGGAITTADDELARMLRLLGYHGMSRDSWSRYSDRGSWYYEVEMPGFKCNLSDLHAALGIAQLARIDELLERRRTIAPRFRPRSPVVTGSKRRAKEPVTGTPGTCT
jgi:dTDP-4-amino-4,6-dideoxygalactose transaminase